MKKDLEFAGFYHVDNHKGEKKEFGKRVYDLWEELIKANEGKEFTIGHIVIYSSNHYNIQSNRFLKLDKVYDLSLYTVSDNNNMIRLYDFSKGWLAPLNFKVTKDMKQQIILHNESQLTVLVSVV